MKDVTENDIFCFLHEIVELQGVTLNKETDLFADCGIDGDDWDPLLTEFARRFHVNMDSFIWYYHYGEEGFNPFWLILPPPYFRVKRIPINPRTLLESARLGRWCVEYPEVRISQRRYDVLALWACGILLLASGLFYHLLR